MSKDVQLRPWLLPISLGCILTVFSISIPVGRSEDGPAQGWLLDVDQVRIVFPSTEAAEPGVAQRLVGVIDELTPLRGVPSDIFKGKRITISLATQPTERADAVSRPDRHLIILPMADAARKEPDELRRTILHELAHLGVNTLLDNVVLPLAFEEGFAEWASGGVRCRGEMRIRVELMIRKQQGLPLPRLFGSGSVGKSRLAYDLLATFIDYLNDVGGGVIEDGTMLESISTYGFHAGLTRTFRKDLVELEEGWRSNLTEQYEGLPDEFPCDSDTS